MCHKRLAWVLLLTVLTCAPAQVLETSIPLDDGDPVTSDRAFGIALDPDGIHAYVALCGDLPPFPLPPQPWAPAWNNDKVVKINLQYGTQIAQATVGHFPEDIALTRDATGQARHIWVANSSSGTVTCLTPALGPVQTVLLSPCFGGTYGSSYPFGIEASADGTRVYVLGTSCGTIDVIDSDPASPSFAQIIQTHSVPNAFGRLAWLGPGLLAIPVTQYVFNPSLGFSDGSRTGIAVLDVQAGTPPTTWMVTTFVQFAYPQITDLSVLSDGKVLAPVGFGNSPLLLEIDPTTGQVTRQLDLGIQIGSGLHGIDVCPDGMTAAVTSINGGEVALIDIPSFAVTSTFNTGASALTQPNEVAFTADGSRLAVTLQGAAVNGGAQVLLFRDMPGYLVDLNVDPMVNLGQPGILQVSNVEFGQPVTVFVSLASGPQQLGAYTVYLSNPFYPWLSFLADVNGTAGAVFTPTIPSMQGMTFHLQAGTTDRDSGLRLSGGASTTVN